MYRAKHLPRLPGRNAYRFLKGPQGWSPPAHGNSTYNAFQQAQCDDESEEQQAAEEYLPMHNESVLLNEQGEVERVADQWAKLWEEGCQAFTPPDGDFDDGVLPLSAADLREAARTFPRDAGRGG